MRFLDFFSGIGGFRKGMELAGHECVGFCEFDKFAAASYISMHLLTDEQREYLATLDFKKRQKEILKDEYLNNEWYANDIRTVDASNIPKADCWCGGFPCQDLSVAGKQLGFKGKRSSLFFEIIRLLHEQKEEDRPEWIILENVKNLFSINGGWDFARVLIELDGAGYNVQWQLFNSKDWGVPQNRERVYIVGHLRSRGGTAEIFPITGAGGEDNLERVNRLGSMPNKSCHNPQAGRCYADGLAPCLSTMGGGNTEPMIVTDLGGGDTKDGDYP